mmetsp:Transcript_25440/g.58603  ORF Transcript_25440/g.58603 Transcript_25440/m.58603 type:complete len:204 (-) Transcript_25440:359-970(-)
MGGEVEAVWPCSNFWRANALLIIQPSTMATLASVAIGCPTASNSSTVLSSGRTPCNTGNFCCASLSRRSGSENVGNPLREVLPPGVVVPPLLCIDTTEAVSGFTFFSSVVSAACRLSKLGSFRRCCRATACRRLHRCTISMKKLLWVGPPFGPFSANGDCAGASLAPQSNGVSLAPPESKTMDIRQPSSHLADIFCNAPTASQ